MDEIEKALEVVQNEEKLKVRSLEIADEAKEKWKSFTNENLEKTNFIVLEYDPEDNKKLILVGSGENGISEVGKIIKDNVISFVVIKGYHSFGKNKLAVDLVLQWIPERSNLFQRGKSIYHTEDVAKELMLVNFFVIERMDDRDKLDEEYIELKIQKITGVLEGKMYFKKKNEKEEEEEESKIEIIEQLENLEVLEKKMMELSKQYKIKLPDEKKTKSVILKIIDSCEITKNKQKKMKCELILLSDIIILCGSPAPKKFSILNLGNSCITIFPGKNKESIIIKSTTTMNNNKKLKEEEYEISLNSKLLRDDLLCRTTHCLIRSKSQIYYLNKFRNMVIYQSFLDKDGGKFAYNLKKRWHVLSSDNTMRYYETPNTSVKMKGSYQIIPGETTIGRGKDVNKLGIDPKKNKKSGLLKLIQNTKSIDIKAVSGLEKKELWMFIDTPSRTYFMMAEDVVVLDNWVKTLELMGGIRKDCLSWEMEQWQSDELEKLNDRVKNLFDGGGMKQTLDDDDDDDFDLPDLFGNPNVVPKKNNEEEDEGENV